MKLCISGGRDRYISDEGYQALNRLHEERGFTELANGMATGIDKCARNWGDAHGILIKEFPAKWNKLDGVPAEFIKVNKYGHKYNSKAGLTRNIFMLDYLDEGDYVIVFPGGSGSTHCLNAALDRDYLVVLNWMNRMEYVK